MRARATGAAAVLAIAGLVVGFPAAMTALGLVPWPSGPLPAARDVLDTLLRPDDGTVLFGVLVAVGWVAWLLWTASLAVEVAARLRGVRAPRIRGLGWSQTMAAGLVTAALLLTTSPAGTAAAHPAPRPAAVSVPSVAVADTVAPTVPPPPVSAPAATSASQTDPVEYEVREGDTLWDVAAGQLGDPQRWHEIATLNADRVQPDGRTLGPDGWLYPGWTLQLPTTSPADGTLLVQPGDTLSDLAATHLGDPDRWPEIAAASRDIVQPDGSRLTDPDLIDVGWTLRLPAASTPVPVPSAARAASGPGPAPTPATAPAVPAPAPTGTSEGSPPPAAVPPARALPGLDTGPAPVARPPTPHAPAPDTAATARGEEQPAGFPWLVTGLAGAGGLLSGGLWLELRRRRRTQFRHRRPGRALTAPPARLAPVEKTLAAVGATSGATVQRLDAALRGLAATQTTAGQPLPDLAAVHLDGDLVRLHLAAPADLPDPWTGDSTRLRWTLRADTPVHADPDTAAPYPLLATVGADQHGPWLLNLEDHVLHVTGDPTMGQDLARYLAAELAVNPWSAEVQVDCAGLGEELAVLAPHRMRTVTTATAAAEDAVADVVALLDRAAHTPVPNLPTARAGQVGLDVWPARALLVDATATSAGDGAVAQLVALLHQHPAGTGCAVVLTAPGAGSAPPSGTELRLTGDGRLLMPSTGLDLEAVGLTPDEARGAALLLAAADTTDDAPMPTPPTEDGWQGLVDHAGALRPELVDPRDPDRTQDNSLLPAPDLTYLAAAAAVPDDLDTLAPAVPPDVQQQLLLTDPTLDADLAEWHESGPRPKLRLLGPVEVRAAGQPPAKRRPYYTELLAFLHAHEHRGATTEDLAAYFAPSRVASDINVLRLWLGKDPATGKPWLPDARATGGVYRAHVLTDVDLFRRLRARAQARGADGLPDLVRALRLVAGRPYDRLRPDGWTWLLDGERLDEYAVCAVVDVAHLVTTAALADGDLRTARLAAQTSLTAAPYSEVAAADLAAVAAAEGNHTEATRLRQQVAAYAEPGEAPEEPSPRGERLLRAGRWGEKAS